jgi:hypothetical protein
MPRAPRFLHALRASALLALGLSSACSATEATPPPKGDPPSYRYRHLETTGLTDELILPDGTHQAIRFAPGSSPADLQALSAVAGCGIFGTQAPRPGDEGFEQRLFLVGELRREVRRTPDEPNRATPEDYREFVLRGWYLEAPFSVPVGFGTAEPGSPGQARREASLGRACPAITAHGDLDRFVRARAR